MARKPPAVHRAAAVRLRNLPTRIPVVAGVDAAVQRQIADVERRLRTPGAVARALARWRAHVHGPARDLHSGHTLVHPCCADDEPGASRGLLESAMHRLPRRAAGSLRRLVTTLDDVLLARTYPDPTADPDAPWWERRLPR